jgi:hypothetical protein
MANFLSALVGIHAHRTVVALASARQRYVGLATV